MYMEIERSEMLVGVIKSVDCYNSNDVNFGKLELRLNNDESLLECFLSSCNDSGEILDSMLFWVAFDIEKMKAGRHFFCVSHLDLDLDASFDIDKDSFIIKVLQVR